MNRRFFRLLSVFLVLILCPLGRFEAADEPAASKPVVRLTIDYGDGVEKRFVALEWKAKMTVEDLLKQAQRHPRGIRFETQGSGATCFLTKIDDLKNEGTGRNWIYRVNDKLGDRSFAIHPIEAGDVVLWKFSEYK
jgi:hypothetical protein